MEAGTSETRLRSAPSHPIDPGGFAPGTILADRYRIVSLAGRGGMGEVYRADDLRLGQPVALKFLPASLENDAAARERLLAEVRSARTVSHPNVCRVYDVGDVGGRVFLTMEYIDGEDLASLLRRIGRLPAAKALEVARQLCAGLTAAHDKGLLHRDLKPANVMIDGRGQARITDFGLAVEATAAGVAADYAGTLAYMAPERFRGKPATVQSDLYALGLIIYETYTGKPAFKANSLLEWERAHADSTPASPSALATDVEPAVERAILRCLEKDPTRRPASAAQVAAALPGGDPLAAALAAGETPSPELVAASGEEGTLPRAKAWLWLVACVLVLAAVPFTMLPFSLTEHIRVDLGPDVLQARAGEVLRNLGYPERPADRAWWFRTDDEYLSRANGLRFSDAAAMLRTAAPGPLRFCYRQSPMPLVPLSATGVVNTSHDPPAGPGDIYLELDLHGGLTVLRVVPPAYGNAQPSSRLDWTLLFDAARLGRPEAFAEVSPEWWPESAADVHAAREGVYAGQKVRVEAAVRAGRATFFRLLPSWAAPPRDGIPSGPAWSAQRAADAATVVMFWTTLVVLAVLAHRNVRMGRGDRIAARRLALGLMVAMTLMRALLAHSPLTSIANGAGLLAGPLMLGLFAWLAYLGFEPAVRRTWPRLLIASTRLLDLRWRDPLVGRAVLAGVVVGCLFAIAVMRPVARLFDLVGAGPTIVPETLDGGFGFFLGTQVGTLAGALGGTLLDVGVLLVVRLIVRRNELAWAVFSALFVTYGFLSIRGHLPATLNPWFVLAGAGFFFLPQVWALWRYGALALATSLFVGSLLSTAPWTLDMSRWYAGRQWVVVAIVLALAFWGFRNVLGKQSAFPAGALDG